MDPPPHLGHVPTPLSLRGSSIARVIAGVTAEHRAHGGLTSVAAAYNRDLRIPGAHNVAVDYDEVCPRGWFTRRELAADVALGRLGLRRPYYGRLQGPARDAFRDVSPDVVFIHEGHYAAASLPSWRRALPDALLVLYLHNPLSRSYSRREAHRLLRAADGMIFVSQEAQRLEASRFGPFPCPAAVVHNGVNHDLFCPSPIVGRAEEAPLRITYVGQVAPHKGVHLMLQAIGASDIVDASVKVVGSQEHEPGRPLSSYEASLRELARSLNLDVEFTPFVPQPEVAHALRGSDVVCVPSVWAEPFGMVALEAMACGAAVISSREGGLPEACAGAATLVDPNNLKQFAAALNQLADPEHLAAQKTKALKRAKAMSWGTSYERLRDVIDAWGEKG